MQLLLDATLAAITIWGEARGECFEGKQAIGEVIKRRMERKYQSDGTVAGTVARAWQFSCWNARDPNRVPMLKLDSSDNALHDCLLAWQRADLANPIVPEALLYLNPRALAELPGWARPENLIAVIGRHNFYSDG